MAVKQRTSFKIWLLGLCLTFLTFTTSPDADDGETFFDGLAAFDGGDLAETVRIWSTLAEDGNVQAYVGLAGLYLSGNGVSADPKEAARLYQLAAEQGDSNGQLNLGRLYLTGIGVAKNDGTAYAWLGLAAAQGRRWAKEKVEEIEPRLSADQRAEADALIKEIEGR